MKANSGVRVAQRFQKSDFATLQCHNAPNHKVHQEHCDAEEYRWEDIGNLAKLFDLAVDIGIRDLSGAVCGACAAIGFEKVVDGVLDRFRVEAGAQLHSQVVKGAGAVHSCGKRAFGHPSDTVVLIVGNHAARPDRVNELGREHRAGNGQAALVAVKVRAECVAYAELCKGLVDDDLIGGVGIGPIAGPQDRFVQERSAPRGKRDEEAKRRS